MTLNPTRLALATLITTGLVFSIPALAAPDGQKGAGKGQGKGGNADSTQIAQRMIEEFDTNGDQALNARELATAMQKMRERRGQGAQGQQGRRGPGAGGKKAGQGQRPNKNAN